MKRSAVICILVFLLAIRPAFAACTSPAGVETQMLYNQDYHTYQFCNGTNWVTFGQGSGGGGGGCTSPAGVETQMLYNQDYHIYQFCNGTNWIATSSLITPTASGLVGYWKLDESSGTTGADSSGNGYTLTRTATPITWLPAGGKIAGALDLGVGGQMSTTVPVAALDSIAQTITVAFWFKANSATGSFSAVVFKRSAGPIGWDVQRHNAASDGILRLDTSGGTNQLPVTFPNMFDGNWHHIAFTTNSGTASSYVDGSFANSGAYTAGTGFGENTVGLLMDGNQTAGDVELDDLRVYNRALSASEIAALYAVGGGNGSCSTPAGNERAIVYNTDFHTYQYCNGASWVPVGKCDPAPLTWVPETAAAARTWRSITYGNGLFVAVAQNGTPNQVMTSPDGITWTSRAAAANSVWQGVTYGNGLFVAVSSGGAVMTSPDGITWTSQTAAGANAWLSVTYGNSLFVAVSTDGHVMTSPDGITWTAQTAAEANQWNGVAYGNGVFVAVSGNGTHEVMTSPDGVTWTARTAAGNNAQTSVTYGNGLFVAVAFTGNVMTSPDGITWTGRGNPEANPWNAVTYGNGLFVAVAQSGTHQVITSPNGITWTLQTAAEANQWNFVTYGNGLFVAVAQSDTHRVMILPTCH